MSMKASLLTSAVPLLDTDVFYVARPGVPGIAKKLTAAQLRSELGVLPPKLLVDADGMDTGGADLVRMIGNVAAGYAAHSYFKDATVDLAAHPKAGFTASGGQKYRIVRDEVFTPQSQLEATDPDWTNAFARSLDYLASIAVNGNGGGAYPTSPDLFIPTKSGPGTDKYPIHAPIEIRHTLHVRGEGGQSGPGSFGGSCIQVPDGINAIITHFPGTIGTEGLGGAGNGGHNVRISDLMFAGPATGTTVQDSSCTFIICRTPTILDNIYGRGGRGDVYRMWTGVVDGHNYGGDCSTSQVRRVKGEGCRGTGSNRGTDSNLIIVEDSQGYQNMQYAFFEQNAAGSTTYRNCHETYCGIPAPAGGPFTQCHKLGNIFTPNLAAVNFADAAATSALLAANPPPATATNNPYWVYVRAGGPTSTQPDHASGGPWIWGGAYLCATPQPTVFDSDYMEGGGSLSQSIYNHTEWHGGTLDRTQVYGGTHRHVTDDGVEYTRQGAMNMILRSMGGLVNFGAKNGADQLFSYVAHSYGSNPSARHHTATAFSFEVESGVDTIPVGKLDYFGFGLEAGKKFSINGVDVLSGQMAAIADLGGGATLGDVVAKVNDMLAKQRAVALLHA